MEVVQQQEIFLKNDGQSPWFTVSTARNIYLRATHSSRARLTKSTVSYAGLSVFRDVGGYGERLLKGSGKGVAG
jgi:hypothetical protein